MDYSQLESLRKGHPAWRLLAADNAVLVASFLHRTFIAPNVRTCPEPELVSKLDDYLYHLNRAGIGAAFPRAAGDYLDDWASDRCGWLRISPRPAPQHTYPRDRRRRHHPMTIHVARIDADSRCKHPT